MEGRVLLSAASLVPGSHDFLRNPPGYQAIRPNTPVLPFGAPTNIATFIDPTVRIFNGARVVLGQRSFVGPYATLNAQGGAVKIGSGSAVLDNASLMANPGQASASRPAVTIGDFVLIGYGATVRGPSVIGAYGPNEAKPTGIGPNAYIDGATIEAGAVVGALARVGPGVVVPSNVYVLSGANVNTTAEATDPSLGKVVPLPGAVAGEVSLNLTRTSALAGGYTTLYQGQSATGANPGVDQLVTPGIFNGSLAAVTGTSQEPGNATATGINFEPSRTGPKFQTRGVGIAPGLFPDFRARITGDARFNDRAARVAHSLGRSNAFRADQGQPITFGNAPSTGQAVTIDSPLGGTVTSGGVTRTVGSVAIGQNFRAESGAVLLGGSGTSYNVGDNVTIGGYAVVDRSNVGAGAVIGSRSYVANSTIAPGQVVPPGTILINNQVVGQIAW